jgi:hypothetical protein
MTAHFLTWIRSQADGAALQELAGWETEKMVRRYAHFAADHLAAYADKLEIHGANAPRAPDFCGTAKFQHVENKMVSEKPDPTRGFFVRMSRACAS